MQRYNISFPVKYNPLYSMFSWRFHWQIGNLALFEQGEINNSSLAH